MRTTFLIVIAEDIRVESCAEILNNASSVKSSQVKSSFGIAYNEFLGPHTNSHSLVSNIYAAIFYRSQQKNVLAIIFLFSHYYNNS